MEIERKFLLSHLPELPPVRERRIIRGYLSTVPEIRVGSCEIISGEGEGEISYHLTIKGEGDLSREEIELPVPEAFFTQAAKFIGKPLVRKEQKVYQVDGHILECSVVDADTPTQFLYGEVEFTSEEEARAYEWPFPGAVDVTYDREYKMKNYWLRTREHTSSGRESQ